MMRLHFTQKSSMTSPKRTSRMRFTGRGPRGLRVLGRAWIDRRQNPFGGFESDVFADAQRAGISFEQITHRERLPGRSQLLPGRIFVRCRDLAAFLVLLALDVGGAGKMRGPAEMLTRRVLHAIDPVVRH